MSAVSCVQTLTESFLALSEEVQSLIDRKTILEHKLRYAHEQVCLPAVFFLLGTAIPAWLLSDDARVCTAQAGG